MRARSLSPALSSNPITGQREPDHGDRPLSTNALPNADDDVDERRCAASPVAIAAVTTTSERVDAQCKSDDDDRDTEKWKHARKDECSLYAPRMRRRWKVRAARMREICSGLVNRLAA